MMALFVVAALEMVGAIMMSIAIGEWLGIVVTPILAGVAFCCWMVAYEALNDAFTKGGNEYKQ